VTKASVARLEKFDGWDTMLRLVEECRNTDYRPSPVWGGDEDPAAYRERMIRRDQALIATLFETGGRVSEVLQLRRENFEWDDEIIVVTGMRVLKRFRKVGEYVDASGRKRWVTEPVYVTRGRFPILRREPLVPYMLGWIVECDGYLFPSPKRDRPHLSRRRALQIVTEVGRRVGVKVWPHYFRSQRASQLAQEYGYTIHKLLRFFDWKNIATAVRYSKLSFRDLIPDTAPMVSRPATSLSPTIISHYGCNGKCEASSRERSDFHASPPSL